LTVDPLTEAPFTELLDALWAADVESSMDPAALNLPGAWLALDQFRGVNAAGNLRLECRLFLISPDTDPLRAIGHLGALHAKVLQVLTPDGPVVSQGVVMPGDPTPLPALSVPVHLYTNGA
jgi:hypothetical protein